MLHRIQILLSKILTQEPIEQRPVNAIQNMLIVLAALFLMGLPLSAATPGPLALQLISFTANLVLVLLIPVAWKLLQAGHLHGAIAVIAIGMLAALAINLINTGLSKAPGFILAIALPIILAGVLAGRRTLWLMTSLSMIVVTIIGLLEVVDPPLAGFLPPPGYPLYVILPAILFTIIAIGLLLDRFSVTLRVALSELQQANRRFQAELHERTLTEATLRDSEELYRLITDNTSDLICMLDEDTHYLYVSPSYTQMLGYSPAILIGRLATEFIHPNDLPELQVAFKKLHRGSAMQTTYRYRHADGSWRWLESRSSMAEQQGQLYIIIVSRDITEKRQLEEQLLQAHKMEGIGRLAGGVAHDFNNLLVVIAGYADLARAELPAGHSVQNDLNDILAATERASTLTRQLLAFARRQIFTPQILDLNELLDTTERLLRRLIPENIEMILIKAPELGLVRADADHLSQVLINLVVNARDAMASGGRVTIETKNIDLADEDVRHHLAMEAGSYSLLAVSDTGIGMDKEMLRHIFEPFYTTKGPGHGTGLGLATCYGIIKQHGGTIWAYSEPGHGTSMKIYLPQVSGIAAAITPRVEDDSIPRGTETVLLAEDNEAVRDLTVRVLRNQGYTVLEAANGTEALQLACAAKEAIHLLLSDVVMPSMGGEQLAEQIVQHHPQIKVLFMSGYTDNAIFYRNEPDSQVALLQKPFTPATLIRRVREVLDES